MIALRLVPKVMNAVTQIWAPNAYTISFKLETDNKLLETKSKAALSKYCHQVRSIYYYWFINFLFLNKTYFSARYWKLAANKEI